MATSTQTHSYCVVQWEDNQNEYAVVHVKRAKTPVALKVGLTTFFEGNNRDRRRGKITYMGNKKDCIVFGFEFEEQDGQINIHSWSVPPGIPEQIKETTNALKTITGKNLRRTISSSSTNSTTMSKNKKRKVIHKEQHTTDNQDVIDINMMPPLSPASALVISGPLASTIIIGDTDQPSGLNDQHSSKSAGTDKTSTTNAQTTATDDASGLTEEIRVLREKVNELEEELILLRETSTGLPDEQSYNYLRNVCSTYEKRQSQENKKAIELAKNLPCTRLELETVKQSIPAATINCLIKCCFKGVNLADMCYEKFKAMDPVLLKNIHEYVKCVHAPIIISKTMFSRTISLKCRHLRSDLKGQNRSALKATTHTKNQSVLTAIQHTQNQSKNKNEEPRTKRKHETIDEIGLEESSDEKENEEHF